MSNFQLSRLSWLLFLLPSLLFSQNLPEKMRFSADGRQLLIGNQADGGMYDSATIRTIYLDFKEANWYTLMTQNYSTKKDLIGKMTVDGVVYDSVGVRFRGQTSYGGMGGGGSTSQKKSFDITTDIVRPDQKIMGYQNLNLMNSFADPSFMRERYFKYQLQKHIPAAKCNYVNLVVNGQSWGVYPNVQQQNKDFLEEWFLSNDGANIRCDRPAGASGGGGGWGDGTAALNWLGADTSKYQQYYTLKNNDTPDPWTKLVNVCNVLNNSGANLETELPKVMDVDRALWHLASEIAFSDDDSYVFKGKMDYFVYYEPETQRWTPLEYDGNSVMEASTVNWGAFYNETKVNYPLLNKVLKVPAFRQRYLAHLRTIMKDEINPATCTSIIENFRKQIDSLVQADPKKATTYTAFQSEVNYLKTWLTTRTNTLKANAEVVQVAPTIHSVKMETEAGKAWASPAPSEQTWVIANATGPDGLKQLNLYYATGYVGNFSKTQMFDDGQHRDGTAGDGTFGGSIPSFGALNYVRFYVEAVSANAAGSVSFDPAGAEHDVYVYRVAADPNGGGTVTINEIMAANTKTATDQNEQYDDWIELYNNSDSPADISGWFLSDNAQNLAKWQIPANTIVPQRGYLIIWCDEDGKQDGLHANFKLTANGESVYIVNPDSQAVQQVDFGLQTPDLSFSRIPNGTGNFVIKAPTFAFNNEQSSGTDDLEEQLAVKISPNPTTGQVFVQVESDEDVNLQVTDLLGRAVVQASFYQNQKVDLSGEPAGIYLFKIGNSVRRVVKTN